MSAVRFGFVSVIIFAFTSILYILVFVWCWAQPTTAHEPLREIHLVKRHFAGEARSPRWLIVGGSSAWFGFDSEMLASATGQPVTNLGTHAEIPLWYQLHEAEKLARAGDTVLLAAELVHYWRETPTTYGASRLGVLAPDLLAEVSWAQRWQLLTAISPSHVVARLLAKLSRTTSFATPPLEELVSRLRRQLEGTQTEPVPTYYNYLELNDHGDFARPRIHERHQLDDYGLRERHEPATGVWRQLAKSTRRLGARKVACISTWPPFERQDSSDIASGAPRENLENVRERLQRVGWQPVGSFEESVFGSEFFYDTAYHLTSEGARERTRRFIEAARRAGVIP